MKRIKLLGLALMAILAVSALAAATSQAALPEMLPEGTAAKPVSFTSVSLGEPLLVTLGGTEVKCKQAKNSGSVTSLKLGTVTITFEGCKELTAGTTCTGLKDTTSGNITTTGSFHFWKAILKKSGAKISAFVVLPESLHFSCLGGIILVELLKEFLKKFTPCSAAHIIKGLNELLNEIQLEWVQEKGDPDIEEVTNEKNEVIKCLLPVSVNHKGEETSAESAKADLKEFKQGGKAITVLLDA